MDKGIIYKYELKAGGETVLQVPAPSQLLSVKEQNDKVVVYFLINADMGSNRIQQHRFYTVGTGFLFGIDREMQYLDTVLLEAGRLVLHVFKHEFTEETGGHPL